MIIALCSSPETRGHNTGLFLAIFHIANPLSALLLGALLQAGYSRWSLSAVFVVIGTFAIVGQTGLWILRGREPEISPHTTDIKALEQEQSSDAHAHEHHTDSDTLDVQLQSDCSEAELEAATAKADAPKSTVSGSVNGVQPLAQVQLSICQRVVMVVKLLGDYHMIRVLMLSVCIMACAQAWFNSSFAASVGPERLVSASVCVCLRLSLTLSSLLLLAVGLDFYGGGRGKRCVKRAFRPLV